jgi:hypothetical protein
VLGTHPCLFISLNLPTPFFFKSSQHSFDVTTGFSCPARTIPDVCLFSFFMRSNCLLSLFINPHKFITKLVDHHCDSCWAFFGTILVSYQNIIFHHCDKMPDLDNLTGGFIFTHCSSSWAGCLTPLLLGSCTRRQNM